MIAALLAVGTAAAVVWWPRWGTTPAATATSATPVAGDRRLDAVVDPDRMAYVASRAKRHDPVAVNELIQAYGHWAAAPDSGALDARRAIVQALLAHPDHEIGLKALLSAVQTDQTPRGQDPMWPHLVRGVGALWNPSSLARGRDLAMLESRTKPRELLIESLTEVRPEALTAEQRSQLVADLIDLYPKLEPEQKPAVDRALTALGSSDLVEILAGRGLADDTHLKAAIEERRAQDEARRGVGAHPP